MPTFQSFWFGKDLPPYQQLTSKSFVDFGHRYVLYAYRKFDVPAGVELRDAGDILPADRIFFYGNRAGLGQGSVSAFSNLFRYCLLHQIGGWWVDTDVVCLSERVPSSDIFMGWEQQDLIGTAILKFPEGHAFVRELCHTAEQAGPDLSWGETGPLLLTRLARKRGLLDLVSAQHRSYPVQSLDAVHLTIPSRRDEIRERIGDSPFLHIWNEVLRRAVVLTSIAPPVGSLMAELFERHRVGFGDAPAYTAEQVQRLNDNYLLTEALARERLEGERLRRLLSKKSADHDAILASTSWRITGPLRQTVTAVRSATSYIRRLLGLPAPQGDLQMIASSDLFDRQWYLERNPDVRAACIDPALHYLISGATEGRNPGPLFDTRAYLAKHPEIVGTEINPLVHYLTHRAH